MSESKGSFAGLGMATCPDWVGEGVGFWFVSCVLLQPAASSVTARAERMKKVFGFMGYSVLSDSYY